MSVSTITPSCINEVMSCKMSVTPVAGMLGTMFVGSDRYIVVCSKVFSPKRVQVLEFLPSEITSKKTVDNGIEMLTDEALAEAIDYAVPTMEKTLRYFKNNNFDLSEANDVFEFDMKCFNRRSNYSLRKNGRWMPKGSSAWGTSSIHWGVGDEYRDPCF